MASLWVRRSSSLDSLFPAESFSICFITAHHQQHIGDWLFHALPWVSILLGLYAAHKASRRSLLLLIVILMTAAIAMIGFAPTYAAVGPAAPLIIVLTRLLQGLATGGKFASATKLSHRERPQIGARGFKTAPGRWSARVWLCLSAHRGDHCTELSAWKHSTVGVGELSSAVMARSGFLFAAIWKETDAFLEASADAIRTTKLRHDVSYACRSEQMSCPDCAKRVPTHRHVWSRS